MHQSIDIENTEQVRWRCRRGMLELDQMLHHFFDSLYFELSQEKKLLFVELLQETDDTLYRWLLGKDLPEASLTQDLVLLIRYLHQEKFRQESLCLNS